MLKNGTIVDGRYVVEKKLGEGGLAAVFRVRHRKLGTTYALKLLKQDSAMIRARLMREGEVQAQLRHPNIASVIDVVDVDGVPGLIMEFVRGSSLDVLLWNETLTMAQVDHLAEGILKGVAAAHKAGTIHRDLKPANILLEVVDGVLTPKVTDFGLAKALDGYTETAAGVMMGTPQYMAPEQMEDASTVDSTADVFSLGAMLFEMAGGERPFDGDNLGVVLQKVFDGDRKTIHEVAPHLPKHKRDAIERALAMDPSERPDVATLLRLWLGDSPVRVDADFTSSVLERTLDRGVGSTLEGATPAPVERHALDGGGTGDVAPLPTMVAARGPTWQTVGLAVLALSAFGVVTTSIAGTGVLAFLLGRGSSDAPVVQAPVPVPVAPAPAPAPNPPPAKPTPAPAAAAPAPAPGPSPVAPRPSPVAPTSAQPAPTAPAPAPQHATAAKGMVKLDGDARTVRFEGDQGGRDGEGQLPAGVYRVYVSFAGEPEGVAMQRLVVPEGGAVIVRCSSLTFTCTAH